MPPSFDEKIRRADDLGISYGKYISDFYESDLDKLYYNRKGSTKKCKIKDGHKLKTKNLPVRGGASR